ASSDWAEECSESSCERNARLNCSNRARTFTLVEPIVPEQEAPPSVVQPDQAMKRANGEPVASRRKVVPRRRATEQPASGQSRPAPVRWKSPGAKVVGAMRVRVGHGVKTAATDAPASARRVS